MGGAVGDIARFLLAWSALAVCVVGLATMVYLITRPPRR